MYASNAARIADSIIKTFPEIPESIRGSLFMRIRNELLDARTDPPPNGRTHTPINELLMCPPNNRA
jgi:hypothetical protein